MKVYFVKQFWGLFCLVLVVGFFFGGGGICFLFVC